MNTSQAFYESKKDYQSHKKYKPVQPAQMPVKTQNASANISSKQNIALVSDIKFPKREIETQDEKLAKKGRDEAVIEAMREEAKLENKNPTLEGKNEAIKESVTKQEQDRARLDGLVAKAQEPLITISQVFPFSFFPTRLSVEPTKVNLVTKEFFSSEGIHSIYIKDVTDITIQTDPFFATLQIIDAGYKENSVCLKWLKKKEAHKARRMIQGLVIANKHDIDISKLNGEEIKEKIEELGKAHEV